MDKAELIFIIIEFVFILIEVVLNIIEVIQGKKLEKEIQKVQSKMKNK